MSKHVAAYLSRSSNITASVRFAIYLNNKLTKALNSTLLSMFFSPRSKSVVTQADLTLRNVVTNMRGSFTGYRARVTRGHGVLFKARYLIPRFTALRNSKKKVDGIYTKPIIFCLAWVCIIYKLSAGSIKFKSNYESRESHMAVSLFTSKVQGGNMLTTFVQTLGWGHVRK